MSKGLKVRGLGCAAAESLISRDGWVIFKWPQYVEGHFDVGEALIQIGVRALRVESCTCCNYMILSYLQVFTGISMVIYRYFHHVGKKTN